MDKFKTPKTPKRFNCDKCDFTCSKLSDFNRHLSTGKHKRITMDNQLDNKNAPREYRCECGKKYLFCSGLSKHKKKCNFLTAPEINQDKTEEIIPNNKDVMIEKLVEELTAERAEKSEMKSMFMVMVEKCQEMQMQNNELVNKVIDVIPKMGNTTNNNTTNNNTLNFYLTNTCRDAESIHDFADRYVKQCTEFFIENYRSIANNQICLATNVYNIMFKCLKDNPQYMNFIQTTDIKNGVHYVKEKKKDENRQLYGEAEFIKYVDGFEKAGASIGHAINKSFFPLQAEFARKLEQEIGNPPNEEDYEDEDDYEDALYQYKIRKRESSSSLQTNVCNTMSMFDSKTRKMDILKKDETVEERMI